MTQEDTEELARRTKAAEDADVDVERVPSALSPDKGGRTNLGRTAAEDSAIEPEEDLRWAELDSTLDVSAWTFPIVLDEETS